MAEVQTQTTTSTSAASTPKPNKTFGLSFRRLFTKAGISPYDEVEWEKRTATIADSKGNIIFEQKDVEVPKDWTMTATNIEPDGRVEGRVLANQKMHEFVVECGTVFRGAEVALGESPVANGFGNATNELANPGLALWSPELAVKVFAGNDVGCRHRPVFGNLDVFLLEDDVAF